MGAIDLGQIAGNYAAHLGWRVHPLRARDKRPLLKRWPEKATTDPAIIRAWWNEWPNANIGVATGQVSGIFVLDIDSTEGEASLAAMEREHGPLPGFTPLQWTGGGGWHAVFTYPAGRTIRSSASRLGPCIDVRGQGGCFAAAPSVHPSGRRYQWAEDRSPALLPPVPAPQWLVDLLDPPEAPEGARAAFSYDRPATSATQTHTTEQGRYLARALESELALVAACPPGRRNDQLNRSSHTLFRFAADGRMPASIVRRGLYHAARHAGLSEAEINATIDSAGRARGIDQ